AARAQVVVAEGRMGRRRRVSGALLNLGGVVLTLILIVLLGATMAGTAALLVPGAQVVLEPVAQPVSVTFDALASPDYGAVDYARAAVPARLVQVILSGRGEAPTSGSVEVADAHAAGQIVFVNRTNNPVAIPKGTVVRASSGVSARFYTVADAALPGAVYASRRVGIIALEPGPVSNVKALTINRIEGDLALYVEALNDAPTQGGSIVRQAVVAQPDFARWRSETLAQLGREAYEQLEAEIEEAEFVPPDSLDVQVMSQRFDQVLDQRTDVLTGEMQVVARALAVDGAALRALAQRFIETQAQGDLAQGDLAIIPDSLVVQPSDEQEVEGRTVRFRVTARGALTPVIAMEQVRRELRGKSTTEAVAWLEQTFALRSAPRVTITPAVWERLPLLPARIEVTISVGRG
ncbi:MAG: hypothetical protein V1772_09035, partial [Chloroflexota bacterium]